MSSRNEVFYVLGMQRNGNKTGDVVPVATYALYTDAYADGLYLPIGWHMRIERVSVPHVKTLSNADKFTWDEGDVTVDE